MSLNNLWCNILFRTDKRVGSEIRYTRTRIYQYRLLVFPRTLVSTHTRLEGRKQDQVLTPLGPP